jgi:hypothetical protein
LLLPHLLSIVAQPILHDFQFQARDLGQREALVLTDERGIDVNAAARLLVPPLPRPETAEKDR